MVLDAVPGCVRYILLMKSALLSDALWMALLTLVSVGAGVTVNQMRHPRLPLIYTTRQVRISESVANLSTAKADSRKTAGSGLKREITLEEFQDFALNRKGMVIDARPSLFYRQGHVPGALNVSRERFETDYRRERETLENHRDQPVAVYCSEADCTDSDLVADALLKLGYVDLLVYKEGWAEWTRAGMPEEK